MKLLIQPGDSIMPLVNGINSATKSVEIVIFRFDRSEIERALANAVKRGVFVHALIAHKNRAGEDNLRKLEMRLLADGVTVVRSADDLTRYHGKLMIVDRRELHLFSFNLTYIDIERSRSFAIITDNQKVVQEAVKLFEADAKRQPYDAGLPAFVVSPANARRQLSEFIKEAKTELLIYDPKVSDPAFLRLLEDKARAGLDVRVIGKTGGRRFSVSVKRQPDKRLHVRAIIADGSRAFIGSQSLRRLELDKRREIGIIVDHAATVRKLSEVFELDWAQTSGAKADARERAGSAPADASERP